jgi:outer membrane protein assembly factor BamA
VRARRPWSLTDNSDAWRVQPLAAEGALQRITSMLTFDSRNHPVDPTHGWWISFELERGLSGGLHEEFEGRDTIAPNSFWHSTIDVRRFARLGPSSHLGVRILSTGSLDGGALPVQRQHALGGEGSLPGFSFHQFDCGAAHEIVRNGDGRFQRYYGCDRAALLQLEYQTDFTFLSGLRGSKLDQLGLFQRVRLVGFLDAGRAWNESEARGVRGSGNSDFSADAGAGIRFGRVGAYWAVPLSGSGQPLNFFVRVGPRF